MSHEIGTVRATMDRGAASTSAALIGRIAGRQRLLAALSAPRGADEEMLVATLISRVESADPGLAQSLGLRGRLPADLPRYAVAGAEPGTIAVVAGSARVSEHLVRAAERTAWRVVPVTPVTHDPADLTGLLLRPDLRAVLLGAGSPPGADERGALDELLSLIGAARQRRPGLAVLLVGAAAERRERFGLGDPAGGDEDSGDPVTGPAVGAIVAIPDPADRPASAVAIGLALERLDPAAHVVRDAVTTGATVLAEILDRRVLVVDVGQAGGLMVEITPGAPGQASSVRSVVSAAGGLVPLPPDPLARGDTSAELSHLLEELEPWLPEVVDRHRISDRLVDLRAVDWSGSVGDGAALRLAAARAALTRLESSWRARHATGNRRGDRPILAPDIVLLAGGAFAGFAASTILQLTADAIRRSGACQVAWDHARLLGPLGAIPDPAERRSLLADLADDLLLPLGSIILPADIRSRTRGGQAGEARLQPGPPGPIPLHAGTIVRLDLAPGATAAVDLRFRAPVRLGIPTRRAELSVAGGLAGLLIDLRGTPIRLPEWREERRAVLAAWDASPGPVVP